MSLMSWANPPGTGSFFGMYASQVCKTLRCWTSSRQALSCGLMSAGWRFGAALGQHVAEHQCYAAIGFSSFPWLSVFFRDAFSSNATAEASHCFMGFHPIRARGLGRKLGPVLGSDCFVLLLGTAFGSHVASFSCFVLPGEVASSVLYGMCV